MTKIDEERSGKPTKMDAKRRAYVDLGRWMEMAAQTQEAIHALVGAKGRERRRRTKRKKEERRVEVVCVCVKGAQKRKRGELEGGRELHGQVGSHLL